MHRTKSIFLFALILALTLPFSAQCNESFNVTHELNKLITYAHDQIPSIDDPKPESFPILVIGYPDGSIKKFTSKQISSTERYKELSGLIKLSEDAKRFVIVRPEATENENETPKVFWFEVEDYGQGDMGYLFTMPIGSAKHFKIEAPFHRHRDEN